MAEMRTAFAAEVAGHDVASAAARLGDILGQAGGSDLEGVDLGDDRRVVIAEFRNVSDSTRAAVELVRAAALDGPEGRGGNRDPLAVSRMALCTAEVPVGGTGSGSNAPPATGETVGPRARARALLEHAEPAQVLMTTSTAVMAGRALPPGTELRDRGGRTLVPGLPAERIYEFRVGRAAGSDGDTASNLDWARRSLDAPVVGMDDQLAELVDTWRAAIQGKRRTVLLSGEGGVGKTALAAELALRLHAEDTLVLYGRWDQDVVTSYQGFREALGVYADRCPTDQLLVDLEGWGDAIARLLPDVGARVGAPAPGSPETRPAYDDDWRLFDAVEAWLRALTRRRPTLLMLDDLHWAEIPSLRLLDRLHLASASLPLLTVVTADEQAMEARQLQPLLDACVAHAEPDEFVRVTLGRTG